MAKKQKCARCGVDLKNLPWFGVVMDGRAVRICKSCQKEWENENIKNNGVNRMRSNIVAR